MKFLDKIIEVFIEKISPFLIVICGTFIGYLFGDMLALQNSMSTISHSVSSTPSIIGAIIGFIMFGIIGRFAWNEFN